VGHRLLKRILLCLFWPSLICIAWCFNYFILFCFVLSYFLLFILLPLLPSHYLSILFGLFGSFNILLLCLGYAWGYIISFHGDFCLVYANFECAMPHQLYVCYFPFSIPPVFLPLKRFKFDYWVSPTKTRCGKGPGWIGHRCSGSHN
jgi:hypothetical protein